METVTVRVSRATHAILRELAAELEMSMAQVVDEAARDLQKKRFWADYHASYDALAADARARADFEKEFSAWDVTLLDGLEVPLDEHQGRGQSATG